MVCHELIFLQRCRTPDTQRAWDRLYYIGAIGN